MIEDPGDGAGQHLTVDVSRVGPDQGLDLPEALQDPGKQFPGDFAGPVDRPKNLVGLALEAAAELGNLVAGSRAMVGSDSGHPGVAH